MSRLILALKEHSAAAHGINAADYMETQGVSDDDFAEVVMRVAQIMEQNASKFIEMAKDEDGDVEEVPAVFALVTWIDGYCVGLRAGEKT